MNEITVAINKIVRLSEAEREARSEAASLREQADELLDEITDSLIGMVHAATGLFCSAGNFQRQVEIRKNGASWADDVVAKLDFSVGVDGKIWFSLQPTNARAHTAVETSDIDLLAVALSTYKDIK